MSQLPFRWPTQTSYAAGDFVVGSANAQATEFLQIWPDGKSCAMLLVGPAASGKTHLARRWGERMQAGVIDKALLGTVSSAQLWRASRSAVLEDIHAVADEAALFHLLRHAEAHRLSLLLTSRVSGAELTVTLPDLRSRLIALPSAFILAPDETLLRAFLIKRFADRQWRVEEDVIAYLLVRMERSFAGADALVERIDAAVAESKREITIPLVRNCF